MMKLFSTGVLLAGLLVALSGVGQADQFTNVLASASMESGTPFLEVKCAVTNLYNRPINANIYIIDSDGNRCEPDLNGSAYCTETNDNGFATCSIPPGAIGWVNCENGRNDYCEVKSNAPQGTVLGSLIEQLDLPGEVIGTPVVATLGALELHPVGGPLAAP